MATLSNYLLTGSHTTPLTPSFFNGTAQTIALDSAYTYNTAGCDAYAIPFIAPETASLTDFWVAVSSFSGTWSSTDGVINYEVRGPGVTAANFVPNATLAASGTITLAGTESGAWVKKSGLSVSLTQGECYYLVIGDADGTSANFVTMSRSLNSFSVLGSVISQAITTTAGWTTAGTTTSQVPMAALKIGGRVWCGAPWSATTSGANNSLWRGNRVVMAAAASPVAISGLGRSLTNFAMTWRVYEGASAIPNDTPIFEHAPPSYATGGAFPHVSRWWPLNQVPVLLPGRTYWIVGKPSTSSAANSNRFSTYTNVDDDLRSALFGVSGMTVNACVEVSGGASWTVYDDQINQATFSALVPAPIPTTATVACG